MKKDLLPPGQTINYTRSQGYKKKIMLNSTIIMLINVKMPTNIGILTFISRINTISESLKARKVFIFQHFGFYELLKFYV